MATSEVSRLARLECLLARCEADRPLHMVGGGATENELQRLEQALGRSLPESYRVFLRRLGGGVFYLRHELFGASRVMIHDIELLPDLLSFRTWLGAVPTTLLPIHRSDGRIHALDLDAGPAGLVRALGPGGRSYADFPLFLEQVILR